MIDIVEMYGNGCSESLVGEVIVNIDWEKLFLIDKVLFLNVFVDRMFYSLDISLKLLGIDYVDLYLYYWCGVVLLSEIVEMF